MSVSYGGDSIVFADGSVQSGGWTGMKNRIINGDMRIDQRNAGASVSVTTSSNAYSLDRWVYYNGTGDGDFTIQQTGTGLAGFTSSLKFTVTTADSTLGAGDYYLISQKIEGYNVADLAWGTASAKTITISFQVYSSVTGTFGGVLRNGANNRFYPFTYTISSANTWETKSVTIAGDTTGTWETTTSTGIEVIFSLGANLLGTAGSWSGTAALGVTGQTNLMATLNATWYITGVQLERGSTASSFEYRSYTTELQLCQRYYYRTTYGANSTTLAVGAVNTTTSAAQCGFTHPVTMRASPTAAFSGVTVYDGSTNPAVTSITTQSSSTTHLSINVNATAGGLTVGRSACILAGNSTQYLDFSIEL